MIYFILLFISLLILLKKPNKYSSIGSIIFIFLLLLIGGFRDITIGTDTEWYFHNWFFTTFKPTSWNHYTPFEPGFNYFIAFFKEYISSSYTAFYSTVFFITYLFPIIFIKRLKLNYGIYFALCYITFHYGASLNIMRQYLALNICFLILVIAWKEKHSLILYEFLICAVAILLHKSMFMLCIFPLFDQKKIQSFLSTKILIIFLFLATGISILGKSFLESKLDIFLGVFGSRADDYISSFIKYGLYDRSIGYAGQFLNTLFLILISRGRRNGYFYCGIFGLYIYIITASFMPVIGRLALNYSFLMFIYLVQNWFEFKKNKTTYYLSLAILLYYVYSLYYTLLINTTYNPYNFYF